MDRFYHISDLHIKRHSDDNMSVAAKLDQLYLMDTPGYYLLVTGDIVENGWASEYAQARMLLSPWAGRIILVPGNHDYGFKGLNYRRAAKKRWREFYKDLEAITETNDFKFVTMNSVMRHWWSIFKLARGKIGFFQRKKIWWAARNTEKMLVTCVHHDPYSTDPTVTMEGGRQFIDATRNVSPFVMYGHSHEERTRYFPHPESGRPTEAIVHSAGKFVRMDVRKLPCFTRESFEINASK